MRRTLVMLALALAGIAFTAAVTWGTSQLVRQRIGLASEPLNAGRRLLAPSAATRAPAVRQQTRTVTRTVSTPRPTPAPTPAPSIAPTQTTPAPAERPSTAGRSSETEATTEGEASESPRSSPSPESGDSSARRDD